MTDTIKKGDFIEIDYDAYITDDKELFDTTSKEVAEKEHLHIQKNFKPAIICVGEGHVLPGLDTKFDGATLGKHTIALADVDAFGKKDAKLLQLIPRKVFKEQNLQPMPGLEIDVDGQKGIIRSASGGRVIVDFNHPLSSKDVTYEVDIKRKVTDQKEQTEAIIGMIGLPYEKLEVKDGTATVTVQAQLPPQLLEHFTKDIVRLTGLKDFLFKTKKPEEKKE